MFLYSLLIVQLKAILEIWGRCIREKALFPFSTLHRGFGKSPRTSPALVSLMSKMSMILFIWKVYEICLHDKLSFIQVSIF